MANQRSRAPRGREGAGTASWCRDCLGRWGISLKICTQGKMHRGSGGFAKKESGSSVGKEKRLLNSSAALFCSPMVSTCGVHHSEHLVRRLSSLSNRLSSFSVSMIRGSSLFALEWADRVRPTTAIIFKCLVRLLSPSVDVWRPVSRPCLHQRATCTFTQTVEKKKKLDSLMLESVPIFE